MSETKTTTIQIDEDVRNELDKYKSDDQSVNEILKGILKMQNRTIDLEKEIAAVIKADKELEEKYKKIDAEVKSETDKRKHLFEKFHAPHPMWIFEKGVTRIVFDGQKVTFSREGKEPFSFDGIKECEIRINDRSINRNNFAPFDITTKYKAGYTWHTWVCKGGVYEYFDGSYMGVTIRTPSKIKEDEKERHQMMEELGCCD